MKTIHTHALELSGSSYEAGRLLGSRLASVPGLKKRLSGGFPGFGQTQFNQASQCFSRWCPGLNEELAGFADALGCAPEQVLYYGMTWLTPRCSHLALLPSMTASGHPMTARNYEFNDEAEDFTVIKTCIKGKYTHIGTSVLGIGRDDGINEMGLTVTLSSSGFPVGPLPEMRRPAVTGLQFWAVVRTLLENCRDVKEALSMLKDMPVAYNLNLIVLDREGRCALVETLDGRMAVKTIDSDSGEQALYATNHPVLEELIPYEPKAFVHSIRRYDNITAFLERHKKGITAGQLKDFFLTPYPEGLSCSYYSQFFGTTKPWSWTLSGAVFPCAGEDGLKTAGMTLTSRIHFPRKPLPSKSITRQRTHPSLHTGASYELQQCHRKNHPVYRKPPDRILHRGGCGQGGGIFLLPFKPAVLRRPR